MYDDSVLRQAIRLLHDLNLEVADVEVVRLTAASKAIHYSPMLERAALLEARHVIVVGDDPIVARLADNFAELCRLGKVFGLTIDLEFEPWTAVRDLATAVYVVREAGEQNGGIIIDALHLERSNTSVSDIAMLDPSEIHLVQLCDGNRSLDLDMSELIREARTERLMPGDGDFDLLGLLRSIPPGTPISLEVPNGRLARETSPAFRAQTALQKTRCLLSALSV